MVKFNLSGFLVCGLFAGANLFASDGGRFFAAHVLANLQGNGGPTNTVSATQAPQLGTVDWAGRAPSRAVRDTSSHRPTLRGGVR